ncbi:MAG: hypothetical protein HY996_05155 [Micrococcales bacterium]|nr:hypothetical protein [Micrococcales bacterium]
MGRAAAWRGTLALAIVGAIAATSGSARGDRVAPAAGRQVVQVEIDGRAIPVVALVPPGAAPERGWPVVVSLHGQSVDGTRECDHNWRAQAGVVIACPTEASAPWRGTWGERVVLETVRALLQRWTLDPDRVFLSGASTGGIGAWRYAVRRPDRFAGVVPRAGMPPLWTDAVLSNLLGLGTYIVHGAHDVQIRPDADRLAAERLHELGGRVVLRELDGAHSAFPGESAAIAAWMLRQKRNAAPARFSYALSRNLGEPPDRVHWIGMGGRSGLPLALEARVDREAGTIDVDLREGWVERLTVLLDERLVDTARTVVVRVGGVEKYRGTPARNDDLRRRLVADSGDASVGFDREVTIDLGVPESAVERARPETRAERRRSQRVRRLHRRPRRRR